MSYYRTCPDCGANLDPGECCDCHNAPNVKGCRHDIAEDAWELHLDDGRILFVSYRMYKKYALVCERQHKEETLNDLAAYVLEERMFANIC